MIGFFKKDQAIILKGIVPTAESIFSIKILFINLCPIVYNIESKIFLSNETFFDPMFADCVHAQNDVNRKCSRLGAIKFGEVARIAGRDCQDCRPRLPGLPAEIAEFELPAEVGEVSHVGEFGEVSDVTEVSNVSKANKVSRVSKVSAVSKVGMVNKVSKIIKVFEVSKVIKLVNNLFVLKKLLPTSRLQF